jgi:putative glutathione S-transferase
MRTAVPSRVAPGGRQTRHGTPRHVRLCTMQVRASQQKTRTSLGVLTKTGKVLPQGLLVTIAKSAWNAVWGVFMNELAPQSKGDGKYVRPEYSFVCAGVESFPVVDLDTPRYVLLIGNPCPWCHRVLMAAKLRNLDSGLIRVEYLVDNAEKASRGGWIFAQPFLGQYKDLREVYDAFCGREGGFSGRCTAPVLIDIAEGRIVSNESSDIIENLDAIEVPGLSSSVRLRPSALVDEIDAFNERIFDRLNNGVYKCGFSTSQTAYDESFVALCETLDELDGVLLKSGRFLLGDKFTDVDLRVFATMSRLDAVYSSLFKCVKRVRDYPNLERWFLECARIRIPGSPRGERLWDTVDVDDCRRSYFEQLFPLNPGGIVPMEPTGAEVFKKDFEKPAPIDCFYER